MNNKTTPLKQVISEINAKVDRVNEMIQRVADKEGQIAALGAPPINLEDFFPKLRAWIDAKGHAYARALNPEAVLGHSSLNCLFEVPVFRASLAMLDSMAISDRTPLFGAMSVTVRPDAANSFDAFCFFLPDLVEEKLRQQITTACGERWKNDQIPAQDRRLQMADLHAQRSETKQQMTALQEEINEVKRALNNTAGAQA